MNMTCNIVWGFGQNLIPNSSFESNQANQPVKLNYKNNFTCKFWNSPSFGTPDYFSSERNNSPDYGQKNKFGQQLPYNGNSYVGFYLYGLGQPFSEYIQVRLMKSLVKNQSYCLILYASLADESSYAVNEVDFMLSTDSTFVSNENMLMSTKYHKIVADTFLTNKDNWFPLCTSFRASGGEQYLLLGTFNSKITALDLLDRNAFRRIHGAYYFFDSISLIKVKNEFDCDCGLKSPFEKIAANRITFPTLSFEPNQWKIPDQALPDLETLSIYLKKNTSYKVEITGFADASGAETKNLQLSEARAKAVAAYLTKNDILPHRISIRAGGIKEDTKGKDSSSEIRRTVTFRLIK